MRLGRFTWCPNCWAWERDDYDSTHTDLSDADPENPNRHNFRGTADELADARRLWDRVEAEGEASQGADEPREMSAAVVVLLAAIVPPGAVADEYPALGALRDRLLQHRSGMPNDEPGKRELGAKAAQLISRQKGLEPAWKELKRQRHWETQRANEERKARNVLTPGGVYFEDGDIHQKNALVFLLAKVESLEAEVNRLKAIISDERQDLRGEWQPSPSPPPPAQ